MRRSVNIAFLVLFLGAVVLRADVVTLPGTQDMVSLFGNSDLVCRGRVGKLVILQETTEGGNKPLTTTVKRASIRLEHIYKGSSSADITIKFTTQAPAISAGFPAVQSGSDVIMFLRQIGEKEFSFTEGTTSVFTTSGAEVDPVSKGIVGLQHALADSLVGPPLQTVASLNGLAGFDAADTYAEQRVMPYRSRPEADIALKALAVLLLTGKQVYYRDLLVFLQKRGREISTIALFAVAKSVQNPNKQIDPSIIDDLSELQLPTMRILAMQGIRKLRSPKSVPTLVKHLDDPDSTVQYLAVAALNEITPQGSDYGPSFYDFDKRPSHFIDEWKHWWSLEGQSSYRQTQ